MKKLVIVGATLGIATAIFVGIKFKPTKEQPQTKVVDNRAKVLDDDRLVLKGQKGANEHQIYAALIRLSQAGDPLAFDEALNLVKSNSEWVRMGAAEALARSGRSESLKLLSELLDDPQSKVREKALRSLALNIQPDKKPIFEHHLKRSDATFREKLAAYEALFHLAKNNEKSAYVQSILDLFEVTDAQSKVEVLTRLLSLAPKDEMLLAKLDTLLTNKNSNEDLVVVAMRHLSAYFPLKIRQKIGGMYASPNPKIRKAAMQCLPMACPKERHKILTEALSHEKDISVWKAALQSAAMMPSTETKLMIRQQYARNDLKENKIFVEDARRIIESTKQRDSCEFRFPENLKE